MTYQEKNITVSLASFTLILIVVIVSVWGMINGDGLTSSGVFRLWVTVIILAIVFTIAAMIVMHILTAVVEVIRTGNEDPEIDSLEDERDKLIDLRGTKISYTVSSIGVFLAM
ncbi:MAG: hypothetical protein R3293_19010, partial [Candidatus Promineifilaceae bacterium]|nr:hypothetical protein [Candidatus Promineifilaceae bacterium]